MLKRRLTSKKKSKAEPVDPKTLPVDKLGGAVVYARDGGDIYLGLVHDIFGHWTLSKGHYVEGEDDRAAITRIVNEEIGLPVTPSDLLGENEYVASHPEKGKLLKKVKCTVSLRKQANKPYWFPCLVICAKWSHLFPFRTES